MYDLKYKLHWNLLSFIIIFILSCLFIIPPDWFFSDDIELPNIVSDKIIHICIFIFLSCWLSGQFKSNIKLLFFISLYGILIEFLQRLTPYRSAELLDILANEIGIIIGIIIAMKYLTGWSLIFEGYITMLFSSKRNE
jgi:VanZ family protein|tara:strand:- start:1315 stop:1728 length:414 start_codon:yes stop_codon:yes gene_type:complete